MDFKELRKKLNIESNKELEKVLDEEEDLYSNIRYFFIKAKEDKSIVSALGMFLITILYRIDTSLNNIKELLESIKSEVQLK